MVYREYMKYANPKCSGFFLGRVTGDYPIIGGSTNKYNPIIGEIWKCLERPFWISKRSGMRLEIGVDLLSVTAYTSVHGYFTDIDEISLDSITVTNGVISAFGGKQSLTTKNVRCCLGDNEANITFASDEQMFFIAVNRDGATSLHDISIKCWDLALVNCDYKVVI